MRIIDESSASPHPVLNKIPSVLRPWPGSDRFRFRILGIWVLLAPLIFLSWVTFLFGSGSSSDPFLLISG